MFLMERQGCCLSHVNYIILLSLENVQKSLSHESRCSGHYHTTPNWPLVYSTTFCCLLNRQWKQHALLHSVVYQMAVTIFSTIFYCLLNRQLNQSLLWSLVMSQLYESIVVLVEWLISNIISEVAKIFHIFIV